MRTSKQLRDETIHSIVRIIELNIKEAIRENNSFTNISLCNIDLPEVIEEIEDAGYKINTEKNSPYATISW